MKRTRRRILRGVASAATAGLAGCSELFSSASEPPTTGTSPESPTSAPASPVTVEYDWRRWQRVRALRELFAGFESRHPAYRVRDDPLSRRRGIPVHAAVARRRETGTLPSVFVDRLGASLGRYGRLRSLGSDVWYPGDSERTPAADEPTPAGDSPTSPASTPTADVADDPPSALSTTMPTAYPAAVRAVARRDGEPTAVPVVVEPRNRLFVNRHVAAAAGVDVADFSAPSDLLSAAATVEARTAAQGAVVPAAHAPSFVACWESVFLGEAGIDGYRDTVRGSPAATVLADSLHLVDALVGETPLPYVVALRQFATGRAAFLPGTPRAARALSEMPDVAYGDEWVAIPFPGTDDVTLFDAIGVAAPAPTPTPRATRAFCGYCNAPEAQRRVTATLGAIPPRTDVSLAAHAPVWADATRTYRRTAVRLPTMFGLSLPPDTATALRTALDTFRRERDVGSTVRAMVGELYGL